MARESDDDVMATLADLESPRTEREWWCREAYRREATSRGLMPPTDHDRQVIALLIASPHRAAAGQPIRPQDPTDALPLFVAACEPGLPL